jgi:hypothetical protein
MLHTPVSKEINALFDRFHLTPALFEFAASSLNLLHFDNS